MPPANDSRRARSEVTRNALMRAAEKLIAEHGVANISIREIVASAGQKNESALQYHFKNLSGLLAAIHAQRSEQVRAKREQMLAAVLAHRPQPGLRELCTLMVEPTFQLAREQIDFRRYVKAFGHELALTESSPLRVISSKGGGGESGHQIGQLLRRELTHLDEDNYRRRMEAAIMLCSASMYHQARQAQAFRGQQAELFLHNLIDALTGLLGAPVSAQTRALSSQD